MYPMKTEEDARKEVYPVECSFYSSNSPPQSYKTNKDAFKGKTTLNNYFCSQLLQNAY